MTSFSQSFTLVCIPPRSQVCKYFVIVIVTLYCLRKLHIYYLIDNVFSLYYIEQQNNSSNIKSDDISMFAHVVAIICFACFVFAYCICFAEYFILYLLKELLFVLVTYLLSICSRS